MHTYLHKVHYYETDQMQVAHHSNYIRWFEEARTDFLDNVGVSYAVLEREGIISPVLAVDCQYHAMTRFGESVQIQVRLLEVKNVKYRLGYSIVDSLTGVLRATGTTTHCFVDRDDRVISLKRARPAIFALMLEAQEPED